MENNYLFIDDMIDINEKPISKEFLEKYPIPQKGKVISGTFGVFNIKDFERVAGRLKDARILRKRKEHRIIKRFC